MAPITSMEDAGDEVVANLRVACSGWQYAFRQCFLPIVGNSRLFTPYLHIVLCHSADILQTHKSIGRYSQEGIEHKHKDTRHHYTRGTNHGGGRGSNGGALGAVMVRLYRKLVLDIRHYSTEANRMCLDDRWVEHFRNGDLRNTLLFDRWDAVQAGEMGVGAKLFAVATQTPGKRKRVAETKARKRTSVTVKRLMRALSDDEREQIRCSGSAAFGAIMALGGWQGAPPPEAAEMEMDGGGNHNGVGSDEEDEPDEEYMDDDLYDEDDEEMEEEGVE